MQHSAVPYDRVIPEAPGRTPWTKPDVYLKKLGEGDYANVRDNATYARPHQGYRNLGKRPIERLEQYVLEHSRPVLSPPATPEAQPGAQPQSRASSEAALDGGEHRAIIDPGAGGNGCGFLEGKVRKPREKSSDNVRDDG